MNMPKFTAEASLYNVSAHYPATTKAAACGGLVQPAGPFSSALLEESVTLRSCWRYKCWLHDTSPGAPFPPHPVWICGFDWVCSLSAPGGV